jgi:Ohr subfamily peroxiredoxin
VSAISRQCHKALARGALDDKPSGLNFTSAQAQHVPEAMQAPSTGRKAHCLVWIRPARILRSAMTIKVLYTAHATSVGGRNGHTQSSDGLVSVDLSIPKSMGGPGRPNTTTPEDLFAAGYAACFGSACEFVSRQMKLHPKSITIRCAVGVGESSDGGFGLTVALTAEIAGVTQAEAERLASAGHEICPYSRAIHGNVEVKLEAQAA